MLDGSHLSSVSQTHAFCFSRSLKLEESMFLKSDNSYNIYHDCQ